MASGRGESIAPTSTPRIEPFKNATIKAAPSAPATAAMALGRIISGGHHVRQQRQEASALDGLRQLALLLGGDRGDAAGHDLAALGDVAREQSRVLVVDLRRVCARERA